MDITLAGCFEHDVVIFTSTIGVIYSMKSWSSNYNYLVMFYILYLQAKVYTSKGRPKTEHTYVFCTPDSGNHVESFLSINLFFSMGPRELVLYDL